MREAAGLIGYPRIRRAKLRPPARPCFAIYRLQTLAPRPEAWAAPCRFCRRQAPCWLIPRVRGTKDDEDYSWAIPLAAGQPCGCHRRICIPWLSLQRRVRPTETGAAYLAVRAVGRSLGCLARTSRKDTSSVTVSPDRRQAAVAPVLGALMLPDDRKVSKFTLCAPWGCVDEARRHPAASCNVQISSHGHLPAARPGRCRVRATYCSHNSCPTCCVSLADCSATYLVLEVAAWSPRYRSAFWTGRQRRLARYRPLPPRRNTESQATATLPKCRSAFLLADGHIQTARDPYFWWTNGALRCFDVCTAGEWLGWAGRGAAPPERRVCTPRQSRRGPGRRLRQPFASEGTFGHQYSSRALSVGRRYMSAVVGCESRCGLGGRRALRGPTDYASP